MTDVDRFKLGMRRLAAGVSLITTRHQGAPHGLIATSVTSVSGEPPSLLICVNRRASAHDPIAGAGRFCVNVLGMENHGVARTFSEPALRAERFFTGDWSAPETPLPKLLDALASFECDVAETFAYGSHTIFIGNVRTVGLHAQDLAPLLYLDGGYHRVATLDTAA